MELGGLRQYEQNLRMATSTPAFRKALKEGKELEFGYRLFKSKYGGVFGKVHNLEISEEKSKFVKTSFISKFMNYVKNKLSA